PPVEGRNRLRLADTVSIDIDTGLCPEAKTDRVPVHPDNSREGSAIRVESRGGVVGLDLVGHEIFLIEDYRTRVIREDRYAYVPVSLFLPDLIGSRLDERFVETVRDIVVHCGSEDGMLAVLAPGLGQRFELHIGRFSPALPEIVTYRVDLGEVQRERAPALSCQAIHDPLFSEPGQFRILKFKVNGFSIQELMELDMRYNRVHTLLTIFLPGPDEHPVYERVCKGRPQLLQGFSGKYPPDKKELG